MASISNSLHNSNLYVNVFNQTKNQTTNFLTAQETMTNEEVLQAVVDYVSPIEKRGIVLDSPSYFEFENELMPLGIEEKIGTLVWSPLSGAMLSGKITRNHKNTQNSRLNTNGVWDIDMEHLYNITDVLEHVTQQSGHTFAQISLAWVLSRPTISSLVIGATNVTQLKENLKAADITLSSEHKQMLDKVSQTKLPYPYWHQRNTVDNRDPYPVKRYI